MRKKQNTHKANKKSALKSRAENNSKVHKSNFVAKQFKNFSTWISIIPRFQLIIGVITIILLFIGLSELSRILGKSNDGTKIDDKSEDNVSNNDENPEKVKMIDISQALGFLPKKTEPSQGWLKITFTKWLNNSEIADNWWKQKAHIAWRYLLKELENFDEKQFEQIINQKAEQIATALKEIKTKVETQEFLLNYFYNREGLWSYKDSNDLSPQKILDNFGGNNFGLCAFALSVLSRLGIKAEPASFENGTNTQYQILLLDYQQSLIFGGIPQKSTLIPVQPSQFWCDVLYDILDKKQNTLEKIKILHLLEAKEQTNEIISKLYRLYLLASQQAAIQTEKTQFYQEAQKYQKLKDKFGLSSSDDIFAAGVDSFKRRFFDDSWNQFRKLLQTDPDYQPETGESVYYYLSLIAAERYEKTSKITAKTFFEIAMKLDVVNDLHRPILLQAARIFKLRNETKFALDILDEFEKHGFADYEIYFSRAELLFKLGEKFRSVSNLRAAITLKPDLKEPRLLLIKRLIELKMFKSACDFCEDSAESLAELSIAYKIAGVVAVEYLNDVTLALKYFEKFLEYQPDDLETQKLISELRK